MVLCMCKAIDREADLWLVISFFYFFLWLFMNWYLLCSLLIFFLFTAEGAENGLEFTIVRPFNWIGPRMDFIPGIDGPSEGVPRVLACFSNVCAMLVVIFPIYLVFHICVVITSCFLCCRIFFDVSHSSL